MSTTIEQEYVLGTHDRELERLGFQNRLWSPVTIELWRRAGLGVGQTILDLGCGPGYASLDLAHLVGPEGKVIAVDVSNRFIESLRRRAAALGLKNIECHVADVTSFNIDPESIDAAYSRWVLCFVDDPGAAFKTVARALKPGAAFIVQDYFNQASETVASRSAIIDRFFQALGDSWKRFGGDPDIGGRLSRLASVAGLDVERFHPMMIGGPPGTPEWEWIESIVLSHVEKLVDLNLFASAEADAFREDWADRAADPHSLFCSPPVVELIARKPHI